MIDYLFNLNYIIVKIIMNFIKIFITSIGIIIVKDTIIKNSILSILSILSINLINSKSLPIIINIIDLANQYPFIIICFINLVNLSIKLKIKFYFLIILSHFQIFHLIFISLIIIN